MAFKNLRGHIDWILVISIIPLILAGLITMRPFGSDGGGYFFNRQIVWVALSFLVFVAFSFADWHFLKNSGVLASMFLALTALLALTVVFGRAVRGSSSWINLYFFSVEPSDFFKLFLILILSKYFSRRHIDIAHFKHIFVSGFYAVLPAFLVFIQPDFGSAVVIIFIWFGMVIVSGISKKHLFIVLVAMLLVFAVSWFFALEPYQKARILNFLNPLQDPRGSGYNALQSMIAVGSGQLWGKGVGLGTQSRLEFLPEHQTDFIFAAFAEEWGFIGITLIFIFFGILIWRILKIAFDGQANFERFFGIGLAIFIMSHFVLHVGMNIGLLPITGLNLPFMSYGGSNLLTIFAGLGILMGMRRYSKKSHREMAVEFLGD